MSLFTKHWLPDGRDALSPASRMILSITVTGITGFLLEYTGIEVLNAFQNTNPITIYFAAAIFALILGPLLVVFRKSSILVPMLIVTIVFGWLVLFNHNHFIIWNLVNGTYVDTGELWAPRIWEFREGAILGLRNPLLIALAAGIIESIVVPVSVGIQKLLTLKLKPKAAMDAEEVKNFFSSSVTSREELKPKRDFGFLFLRIVFIAYGVYFLYQIIGLSVNGKGLPLMSMFFLNPPATINTFMKIILMLSLSTVGAYNRSVRKEASLLLLIGHIISVAASLWLYMMYDVNPLFPGDHQFLLASVAGDSILIFFLLYYTLETKKNDYTKSYFDVELQSPASTIYSKFFLAFGILFTIYSLSIVYYRAFGNPEKGLGAVFGGPDALVSNGLTKYGTLAAIGFFLYFRPLMRKYFTPTLILAFSVSVFTTILYGLQGSTVIITRLNTVTTIPWFMMWHIIVDGGGLLLLLGLRRFYYHVDFQVTSLRPNSAECVMALHTAFRSETYKPDITAKEVLKRIDEYIVSLKSRKRGLLSFPFWLIDNVFPFICWFRPNFSVMSRAEQRWMLRRYLLRPHYERNKAAGPFTADFMYQVTDITHALVTLTYFTSSTGQKNAGYVLPYARERLQGELAVLRPPNRSDAAPLPVNKDDVHWQKPLIIPEKPLIAPRVGISTGRMQLPDEVDYCIVGSGAAGGVLAYRLAKLKGESNSIIVLERGSYFSPVQDFSDDELRMVSALYTEGGLQNTRSFDFTILQAECVGGTTVVNNAICIKMPEISRDEWNTFGLSTDDLDKHYDRVKEDLNIDTLKPEIVNQLVEQKFTTGVQNYNLKFNGNGKLSEPKTLSGNFNNCCGCGLCNIGCRRMRKMSVLETYIPWAQALGVKVYPNIGAVQCETISGGGRKKVKEILIRRPEGDFGKIRINKALIVSAGAISSSRFLMRSGLGGSYAGKGLSCNYAVPPLVEFEDTINAYDGLQITIYAARESYDAIYETDFNPPGTYSIGFPVYFEKHTELMDMYTRSINFTALVGSDPTGTISLKRDILFGRAIEWNQSQNDIYRIKNALMTIARIAKEAGGRRIILPTIPGLILDLDSSLEKKLEDFNKLINSRRYFNFITAHPQGGNMMAADSFTERVVDLDYRVKDTENIFVCDASIFPRGIRVNPQWTIMAMADSAAEKIAGRT